MARDTRRKKTQKAVQSAQCTGLGIFLIKYRTEVIQYPVLYCLLPTNIQPPCVRIQRAFLKFVPKNNRCSETPNTLEHSRTERSQIATWPAATTKRGPRLSSVIPVIQRMELTKFKVLVRTTFYGTYLMVYTLTRSDFYFCMLSSHHRFAQSTR